MFLAILQPPLLESSSFSTTIMVMFFVLCIAPEIRCILNQKVLIFLFISNVYLQHRVFMEK